MIEDAENYFFFLHLCLLKKHILILFSLIENNTFFDFTDSKGTPNKTGKTTTNKQILVY